MNTVGQILRGKARQAIVSCAASDLVIEALRTMDASNTGSVVVLDASGRLAGIFTERDLMRRVVMRGLDPNVLRIEQVVTRELVMTSSDESGEVAMAKMTRQRCRHLPVVDGDRLVGVLSSGDLMKALVDEQGTEIEFLKKYIESA